MFAVDTNVFVFAAEVNFPEHDRCRALLDTWRGQKSAWYTTWAILYEFARVVTHPRIFERPWTARAAWGFVEALLASEGLQVLVETERHAGIAGQLVGEIPILQGNLVHDFHAAALMREHGIRRIYTRDTDFHRFGFLEVVDPVSA